MASQENQSGKANGGLVAAKNMSSAARSQRASKAAAARWRKEKEKEPPYEGPPYAQWRGSISLGSGEPVDCYVLNTGQRVISLRAAVKSIADADSGDLAKFIGVSSMKSFINKDLVLAELLDFTIPGTQFKGSGLTTESFELVLRAYVRALSEDPDSLTDRQKSIAIRCAVITAGLVRTGLDALVDEATGYQYERADDALQVKLRAFIAEELREWEKTFPDELWQEFGRLTNWSGPLHSRPRWWGKLVIELIYDTLDPDVAKYLKNNKPAPGIHWHRQLSEDFGARQLVSRCFEVVGMAKTCHSIRELRDRVAEHYGHNTVQLTLTLPRSQR
ncbi:P63C domain-containing protein [Bordetella bronchiseptica]|uniref:P63C domain-containing protein n=1 Tax=Bordetella bronchiseptica TaxID=518 RepID=UPI00050408CA|nr:P63C domain-containing protein [Bordetella bronchiseptica]KFJ54464.1 P63C domain protein [Bordetella bronchiseptica]SHT50702.1 P63C domain [Mycobacteroides abscessus subsp. abscessus]SUV57467.1 P63C domain [Bordetella bronchiseptica]SUW06699.1 P63C domain [Bordetella bronchiseptica]